MNPDPSLSTNGDDSSFGVEILIEESWMNRLLSVKKIVIPIDENTHLNNLKINLDENSLTIKADFIEKEKSSIRISARPIWDPSRQYLQIEDFKIQTKSKNVMLKSKSWFAQLFLTAKLDRKIEEKANQLYLDQLEKIKIEPVRFPISKAGNAEIMIANIMIHELIFIKHAIRVKASIEGFWKLNLKVEGEG